MLNFAARSINYNSRALFLRYHPCRPLSQLKEPKEEGVVIYNHSQHMTIRIMLGVAIVNFYAWSGHLFNNYFYQGQSVAGIDLSGGDPTIGYVGTAASFGLAYFTRYFANHAVYSVSLTKDERKLHFQVHNFFGNPGKIIEVDVWKAKFKTPLKSTGVKSVLLSSSYIPIQINGLNSYLLVEKEGFGDLDSSVVRSLSDGNALHLDSKTKEDRKEWNKRSYRRNDKE